MRVCEATARRVRGEERLRLLIDETIVLTKEVLFNIQTFK